MVNERLGKPLIPLVGAVSPVALGPVQEMVQQSGNRQSGGPDVADVEKLDVLLKGCLVRLALVGDLDDLPANRRLPVAVLAASPRAFSIPAHAVYPP